MILLLEPWSRLTNSGPLGRNSPANGPAHQLSRPCTLDPSRRSSKEAKDPNERSLGSLTSTAPSRWIESMVSKGELENHGPYPGGAAVRLRTIADRIACLRGIFWPL